MNGEIDEIFGSVGRIFETRSMRDSSCRLGYARPGPILVHDGPLLIATRSHKMEKRF